MNNSYVKPDKSKHIYVLGIDFGHGETTHIRQRFYHPLAIRC